MPCLLLSRLAVQHQSGCKARLVTDLGAANPPQTPSKSAAKGARPAARGGRQASQRRVVEDSPRRRRCPPSGSSDRADGGGGSGAGDADPYGGTDRASQRYVGPYGGKGLHVPRVEAPSHGGTTRPRRGLFMPARQLATPMRKLLAGNHRPYGSCSPPDPLVQVDHGIGLGGWSRRVDVASAWIRQVARPDRKQHRSTDIISSHRY